MATSTYDYLTEEQRARRIPNSPPRSFAAFRDWYLKQGLGGGMGSDEWFTLLIARDADLDSLVYLRYLAETDRRKKEGLPARHPAPSYRRPAWYKVLYIRSPLNFDLAIQNPYKLARDAEKYEQELKAKAAEERERKKAERIRERIIAQDRLLAEQAEQLTHDRKRKERSIKRWSKAGWSRNKMAAKLGGSRQNALALIRSVLG